jgi:hypothetical protein
MDLTQQNAKELFLHNFLGPPELGKHIGKLLHKNQTTIYILSAINSGVKDIRCY